MEYKIKRKEDILIKQEHVNAFTSIFGTLKQTHGQEPKLKEIFINILKDNNDGSLIRLVDLKNRFYAKLPTTIQKTDELKQIFKNLIASNKNNSTHLLRSCNVDWFYTSSTKNDVITIEDSDRKPVQLPPKLERSRTKRYYVFYNDSNSDSFIGDVVLKDFDKSQTHSKDLLKTDFDNIENNKTDYVKKARVCKDVGEIGEKFVLEKEKEILKSNKISKDPVWVSEKNDSFGFDILSYRKDDNKQIYKIFIEVKTTTDKLTKPFFVSQLEMEISQKYPNNYILYRVFNAGDKTQIDCEQYAGDISRNSSLLKVDSEETLKYKVK